MRITTRLLAAGAALAVLGLSTPAQAAGIGWNSLPNSGATGDQFVTLADVWATGSTAFAAGYEGTSGGVVQDIVQKCVSKVCTRTVLPASAPQQYVSAVGGSSASDVWVFGTYGDGNKTVYWHYDGSSWTVHDVAAFAHLQLTQYLGISATEGYATGLYNGGLGDTYSILLHRVGTTWTQQLSATTPQSQLPARCRLADPVNQGFSFSRVVVVGGFPVVTAACDGSVPAAVLKWDGANWRDISAGLPAGFRAGTNDDAAIANVGNQVWLTDSQAVYKRVNGAWSAVPTTGVPSDAIVIGMYGAAASPGAAWLVGQLHGVLATWRFDGSTWVRAYPPAGVFDSSTFVYRSTYVASPTSAYLVGWDQGKPGSQQGVVLRQFGP